MPLGLVSKTIGSFVLVIVGFLLFSVTITEAADISSLRAQIESKNKEIETLEREIESFQKELNKTLDSGKTLQNAIRTLDLTRKKLSADISVTQKKIDSSTLAILSLTDQIGNKEKAISTQRAALGEALRNLSAYERISTATALLNYESLGDFWNTQAALVAFNEEAEKRSEQLTALRNDLAENKRQTETERRKFTLYQEQLKDQRALVEQNRKEKDKLLKITKNNEANYRNLLAERTARKDAFERELLSIESELRLAIDPASIPKTGSGVLSWPLGSVTITQYFGNTAFAKARPQLYNGMGHNGIDLRASEGTPVKAARSGVVSGTGDTDTVCPSASYGKWVLIKHDNGLSTLYAHLSLIRVSEGQSLGTGEVVGYSGNTGYSTGPHLHFTVYASQGVEIRSLKSKVCGGTYRMPVADLKAYLNPLSYL